MFLLPSTTQKHKIMKKLIYLSAFIFLSFNTFGQLNYSTAIGLRAGETSGLTIKKSLGSNALEGIIGVWGSGFSFTGLYEWVAPTNVGGLNWYYGLGGHLAVGTGYYYYRSRRAGYYRSGGFGVGVDGIVGIEYKIPSAPIAFSLDLKPYFEIYSGGGVFSSLDPGLGIKIAF